MSGKVALWFNSRLSKHYRYWVARLCELSYNRLYGASGVQSEMQTVIIGMNLH